MVPAVIDSKANTHSSTLSTVRPTRLILAYTTRATPSKPKNRPSHWRGRTDSPINGAAQAVSTGCMPTMSAERPAGMPSLMAQQEQQHAQEEQQQKGQGRRIGQAELGHDKTCAP